MQALKSRILTPYSPKKMSPCGSGVNGSSHLLNGNNHPAQKFVQVGEQAISHRKPTRTKCLTR